jgi:hypothetical protein
VEDTLRAVEKVAIGLFSSFSGVTFSSDVRECVYRTLTKVHEIVALGHHHDTITGTSKAYVVEDFEGILEGAAGLMDNLMGLFLRRDLNLMTSRDECEVMLSKHSKDAAQGPQVQVGTGSDFHDRPYSPVAGQSFSVGLVDLSMSSVLLPGKDPVAGEVAEVATPARHFHLTVLSPQQVDSRICFAHRSTAKFTATGGSSQDISVTYLETSELLSEMNCSDGVFCSQASSQRDRRENRVAALLSMDRTLVSFRPQSAIDVPVLIGMPCGHSLSDGKFEAATAVRTRSLVTDISAGGYSESGVAPLEQMHSKQPMLRVFNRIKIKDKNKHLDVDDVKLLYAIAGALVSAHYIIYDDNLTNNCVMHVRA